MPGFKPDILLVKLPVPLPSLVLELSVVGFDVVLQQTPMAVTVAPPSDVTLPPQRALVEVIEDTEFVVTVGVVVDVGFVVKLTFEPYEVPLLFVA